MAPINWKSGSSTSPWERPPPSSQSSGGIHLEIQWGQNFHFTIKYSHKGKGPVIWYYCSNDNMIVVCVWDYVGMSSFMSTINYPQLHQEQKFNLLIRAAAMQPPVVGSSLGQRLHKSWHWLGVRRLQTLQKLHANCTGSTTWDCFYLDPGKWCYHHPPSWQPLLRLSI